MNIYMDLKHNTYGIIRIVICENTLYFSASDVAAALGYASPRDAVVRHIDPWNARRIPYPTNGGTQEMVFLKAETVLRFCMESKKKNAAGFAEALFCEAIPSILMFFRLPAPVEFTEGDECEDEDEDNSDYEDEEDYTPYTGFLSESVKLLKTIAAGIQDGKVIFHVSPAIR